MTPAVAVDEPLLAPLAGDNPSGVNLRYDPIYEKVRNSLAIRLNEQNQFEPPEYDVVIRLATEALKSKTKDLSLAAWLTDAWTARQGLTGLLRGLKLLHGLLEQFWDTVHPEIEDGDSYLRMVPVEWVGNYLDPAKTSSPRFSVRAVKLTQAGQTWQDYQNSDKAVVQAFETAFEATPKTFYRSREQEMVACLEGLEQLHAIAVERAGNEAPGVGPLRDELGRLQLAIGKLLVKKLEKDPDPVEVSPETLAELGEAEGEGAPAALAEGDAEFSGEVAGLIPGSRPEALARVSAVAKYLRRSEPASPVSYLLLRAVRWGELRNKGPQVAPDLLAAPATAVRVKLKSLAAGEKWADVLEVAEQAMAGECGRAWLDLQRYTIMACDKLGYTTVADALRSELKCLLADFPSLVSFTLLDDTGVGNPDTLAWISEGMKKK